MKYREVLFRPKLASTWQIPIAVVTESASGVQVILPTLQANTATLGDPAIYGLVDEFLRRLKAEPNFDSVSDIGSHAFHLGDVQSTPHPEATADWIIENVLPSKTANASKASGYSRRGTRGRTALNTVGLKNFTHDGYRPAKDSAKPLANLPRVSHWAGHNKRVLLLEPLVTSKSGRSADQIGTIAGTFARYLLAMQEAPSAPQFSCMAFAVDSSDLAAEARDSLSEYATIVDLTTSAGINALKEQVRSYASAAPIAEAK